MSERLTTTVKHLKDGITSMGIAAAQHSIESWRTELQGYEGTGFHAIATDLGHLHDELGKKEIDGTKVGQLLTKLGKETVKVAKQGDDQAGVVEELGQLLEKSGEQLSRAKASA